MCRHRPVTSALLGLCFAALANLAPQPVAAAARAQIPALAPGMARVLFLRPAGSLNGNVWAAEPMIYANGAAIGDIPAGTEFYRDFRPVTYSFTVQPYGLPAAGWGFAPNTFGILTMSAQLAQAYLPTLTYHPH